MHLLSNIISGLALSQQILARGHNRQYYSMDKKIVDNGKNGGKCLDGTNPGYYVRDSTKDNEEDFLILFPPGAWCFWIDRNDNKDNKPDIVKENDNDYCLNRYAGPKGSSSDEYHGQTITGWSRGLYSDRSDFRDYNFINLIYCDGSGFMGNKEETIKHEETEIEMHLKGYKNYLDLREAIFENVEKAPKNVVLAGMSAGGLAVLHHCDDFKQWMTEIKYPGAEINIKCIADGSYFYDVPGIDSNGKNSMHLAFTAMMQLHEVDMTVTETGSNCLQKYQNIGQLRDANGNLIQDHRTMCFMPQYASLFVKTPMLFIQSAYDTWQLPKVFLTSKMFGRRDSARSNTCNNIEACDKKETVKQMQLYDWVGKRALIEMLSQTRHSIFRQLCPTHGNTNMNFYEMLDIEGFLLRDAIYRYVFCDKVFRAIDDVFKTQPSNSTQMLKCAGKDDVRKALLEGKWESRTSCDAELKSWGSLSQFDVEVILPDAGRNSVPIRPVTSKPKVEIQVQEKVVEKIVYVDKPVEVIKEVEVPKEVIKEVTVEVEKKCPEVEISREDVPSFEGYGSGQKKVKDENAKPEAVSSAQVQEPKDVEITIVQLPDFLFSPNKKLNDLLLTGYVFFLFMIFTWVMRCLCGRSKRFFRRRAELTLIQKD